MVWLTTKFGWITDNLSESLRAFNARKHKYIISIGHDACGNIVVVGKKGVVCYQGYHWREAVKRYNAKANKDTRRLCKCYPFALKCYPNAICLPSNAMRLPLYRIQYGQRVFDFARTSSSESRKRNRKDLSSQNTFFNRMNILKESFSSRARQRGLLSSTHRLPRRL